MLSGFSAVNGIWMLDVNAHSSCNVHVAYEDLNEWREQQEKKKQIGNIFIIYIL